MASLTIRNIPEDTKRRLRQVAAAHGRSMEEHMRRMIIDAVGEEATAQSSVQEERSEFAPEPLRSEPPDQENWVEELRRIANGAGEGVFDPEPQPLREFDL